MLWHQGAILRGSIKKKDRTSNMYLGASGTCPLYAFNSDTEAIVNMRHCVTDGLERETVVTIQRNIVEMLLRAGEFIRNQDLLIVREANPGS